MHVRIWEFFTGGWGGGPGPTAENSLDNFLSPDEVGGI